MANTGTSLKIGDRVSADGEIINLRNEGGRVRMTLGFPGASVPITLDAVGADRAVDTLSIGVFVRVEGKLTRISYALDAHWDSGTPKFEGNASPITLPVRDLRKA